MDATAHGTAQWISERLPRLKPMQDPREVDLYGASYLVAASIGRRSPAPSKGHWQHGWLYDKPVYAPQLVDDKATDGVCLVATDDLVRFLREKGYRNAFAVGLPFVYVDNVHVERRAGSLLVMPPHSLSYTDHEWDEDLYASEISDLIPQFSSIVACISASCVKKGYWTSTFSKYKIPWIVGAKPDDRNALVRMHTLFKSFEYMTTNTMGSHVAYAAYCGCKVSLYGTYASYRREDYRNSSYYQQYPEILDLVIEGGKVASVRRMYPEFFVPPQQAVERTDWAARALGAENRRSGYVIAALLGWPPSLRETGYEYARQYFWRTYRTVKKRLRGSKVPASSE